MAQTRTATRERPPTKQKSTTGKRNPAANNNKRPREVSDIDLPAGLPDEEPRTKKAKKRAQAQPPPPATPRRSEREHMVTTPNYAPQKKGQRPKAQILADKAQAQAEKARLEELAQENLHSMLKMDIEEDIGRAETAAQIFRTLSDVEDDSREEFVGYNDVEGSESDSESLDSKSLKATNKELQKKIKALENAALAQNGGSQRKELGGKKRASQTGTFASGLPPDRSCCSVAKTTGGTKTRKQTHIEISAGGLEDSDAEDVSPYIAHHSKSRCTISDDQLAKGAQAAIRDSSRRNELVAIEESDGEDYTPHPSLKKAAAKIPCPMRIKAVKPSKERTVVAVAASNNYPTEIQAAQPTAPKKPRRLNGNNVRTSHLPEFATDKWRENFLPTLYDKFFTSDQPFDVFYKDSDQFIALLQTIVKEVYPDVNYEVTALDSINLLAYNRINEKRSLIGSSAIAMVKRHIEGLEEGQATKDWIRWARRLDGPLYFQVPSPMNSPTDRKDPGYQYPTGRLLSPFVIRLAAQFLNLRRGSVSDNGFPKGLIALIMAALERAVQHLSKPSERILEFSKDHWGSKIRIYYDGLHGAGGVRDSRWKELLEACSAGDDYEAEGDQSTCDANYSMLDSNHALVFDFCSPEKRRS